MGHVVVEHLLSAFAGAIDAGPIDKLATIATKSDTVFMAISSLIPGQQIPSWSVMRRGQPYRRLRSASISKQATAVFKGPPTEAGLTQSQGL
jgi:hypothetical protein